MGHVANSVVFGPVGWFSKVTCEARVMSLNDGSDNRALVLQATDIVELIGQSVALKRRGKDFVGLCPFHQEKAHRST